MTKQAKQPKVPDEANLDQSYKLKLARIGTPENTINNIRMYLCNSRGRIFATFAGEKADNISPKQYEEYFQKIKESKSYAKFIELSEEAFIIELSKETFNKIIKINLI